MTSSRSLAFKYRSLSMSNRSSASGREWIPFVAKVWCVVCNASTIVLTTPMQPQMSLYLRRASSITTSWSVWVVYLSKSKDS
jgi:hypothetical protein